MFYTSNLHATTYGCRTPTVQCQPSHTYSIYATKDYRKRRIHSYIRVHIQQAAKPSHLFRPAIILIQLCAHEELLCFCKLWGSMRRNNHRHHRHHFLWAYKYRRSFILFALQNASTLMYSVANFVDVWLFSCYCILKMSDSMNCFSQKLERTRARIPTMV